MAAAMRSAGMTLGDLLGHAAGAHAALEVSDLVLDSRQATAGSAFIALAGSRGHGLAHAQDAIARGARVVLYEPGPIAPPSAVVAGVVALAVPGLRSRLGDLAQRFYPDAASIALAGVTGTNGKSTVAWLIAQAMNAARPGRCGYIGTVGFGVPPRVAAQELTTPDCLTLHRELIALGTAHAALEVSSHALDQDRIAGLEFAIAVFTNLTRDHLDAHGDFESYGRAKARLFQRPELDAVVLNLNDPFAARLQQVLPARARLIGTWLADRPAAVAGVQALLTGRVASSGIEGVCIDVEWQGEGTRIASSLVGAFNAENLLSALGALLAWGQPLAAACEALGRALPPPGRMETFGGGATAPTVVVDYAHTPDALDRVLSVLRAITLRRLSCVFGCGGERDPGKRALMGAAAALNSDRIVLTDDNPRGEDPHAIIAAIRSGIPAGADVTVEHNRATAIRNAIREAAPGDTVLIAGKGHEREQIVAGERRPFSDRDTVLAELAAAEARR
jgi:UDP-N-acetylmuramoyl-L-alanyl-D-glutamate--2,6-diaminopimelate ligase